MKKRKSLRFKLAEISKIGTIRTYSRQEAAEIHSQYPYDTEADLKECHDRYDRGLILCGFKCYPEAEKLDSVEATAVMQFTTGLDVFVHNIAYPINFTKVEGWK
jgi:hypothetical protein